jgi:protein Mpv17
LTRFMAYGFIMAPIQHKWFGFLNRIFPLAKGAGTSAAAKRTAFDQLLFAPVGLGAFFTFMTVAEGGGRKEIQKKFQDIYIPSLKANYLVWPAVQLINFRLMPRQFQIVSDSRGPEARVTANELQPFVSTIGIAWTAYLSLSNSAEEA